MMSLILGIDIGTTSSKVVLVDKANNLEVISKKSCSNESNIENFQFPSHHEQNVFKIFNSINKCVEEIVLEVGQERMKQVAKIGVCGQMHGCVLWKRQHHPYLMELKVDDFEQVSNLITWQDGRCDQEFLNNLPMSKQPLSTGFGSATILWLQSHTPKFLTNFDCCGTIADYFVSCLVNSPNTMMSTQNACSWGYYDDVKQCWDLESLTKSNFPVNLLPEIVEPCTVVGTLCSDWWGVGSGTQVMVAMGDMQCSVMSCNVQKSEAVLNLSTSAQLSMVVPRSSGSCHKIKSQTSQESETQRNKGNLPTPVIRVPYFGQTELVTSPSLNGGCVFACYVEMLTEWTQSFSPGVTKEQVYEKLIDDWKKEKNKESNMVVMPTIQGERHNPDLTASLVNVTSRDLRPPIVAQMIARGVLTNLCDMFRSLVPDKFDRVWACGSVFEKNPIFRDQLINHVLSDSAVSFEKNADSAFGAAIAVAK